MTPQTAQLSRDLSAQYAANCNEYAREAQQRGDTLAARAARNAAKQHMRNVDRYDFILRPSRPYLTQADADLAAALYTALIR